MPNEKFEDLLTRMPEIAEAVNHFQSDSIQEEAFKRLMEVWKGSDSATKPKKDSKSSEATRESKQKKSTKKRSSSATLNLVRDLNLAPSGQTTLASFVDEKKPSNNNERNLVAVYYLEKILGIDSITPDHVFTVYRDQGWRIPADLANSLRKTASQELWLDTSDSENLSVTYQGINAIEHDLPRAAS